VFIIGRCIDLIFVYRSSDLNGELVTESLGSSPDDAYLYFAFFGADIGDYPGIPGCLG